jgi:EpsI family protein
MIARSAVVVALLVSALSARAALNAPTPATTAEPLSRFPQTIGSWSGEDVPLQREILEVAAVSDHVNRQYIGMAGELGLYIGYYRSQRQGEALHSPLFCLPGSGWQPIATHDVTLQSASGPRTVKELIVERGATRLLVLYWYQTLRRVTGSEYGRKFFLMTDAFTSGRTDVALVRIIAPISLRETNGEAQALDIARPFAERVLPEVQTRLFRE